MGHEISLVVNGVHRRLHVRQNETLLEVLRDRLQLKSVKASCWRGECGLCTVLLGGEPVKSCMVLALEADGGSVVTVEGLARDGKLTPLQRSFIDHGAVQCGFCTPAFLLVAQALLERNPGPTKKEVLSAVNGLICRCTGYHQIVEAILEASRLKE